MKQSSLSITVFTKSQSTGLKTILLTVSWQHRILPELFYLGFSGFAME